LKLNWISLVAGGAVPLPHSTVWAQFPRLFGAYWLIVDKPFSLSFPPVQEMIFNQTYIKKICCSSASGKFVYLKTRNARHR
jgi:hypothetical protein